MQIKIPVNKDNFHRMYLELINPLFPLQKQEKDLLAQIMRYYEKYKDLPEDVISKMVFDYETRYKIQEELKISEQYYRQILTSLRKKKLIKERSLHQKYRINYSDGFKIEFLFSNESSPTK